MAIEIERKFLVIGDDYKHTANGIRIVQGYICNDKTRIVRVRIYGERAFLTIKDEAVGFARHEFEYEIPRADAEIMLQNICQQPIIDKTRYRYPAGDLCWEIDEFHGENEGLVVAELELPAIDTPFDTPAFVGDEVSDDQRYYNANLINHPYKNW
ncbi:MAG: CYTH domain-containing protein [Paludibacteraceae bacterium]